jgi:hypothetical protein
MAHRNKGQRKREDKRLRREQRERQQQDDVVQHSAATLTCAAETAGDFGDQCAHDQEELALDLPFLHLALEIWRGEHPAPTRPLVAALEELLGERVRYQQALERIGQHLQHLAADPSLHVHLKPLDVYRELVKKRLFPQPSETMTAEQGTVSPRSPPES